MFSFAQQLCHMRQTNNSGGSSSSDGLFFVFLCFTGSLTALVCQHSITPLALPCKLIIPDRGETVMDSLLGGSGHYDSSGELTSPSVCNYMNKITLAHKIPLFLPSDPLEDAEESSSQSVTNSAAELLKQGAGNAPHISHIL